MKELGTKTTDIVATGDCSAAVYYNKNTNKYTATVWNPTNATKKVTFKNANGTTLGTATIGAKALVSFEVYKDKKFDITQAQTPEISVPTGTYDDTQYVEIKSSTEGATIYYTTDGTRPTTSSKVYDGIIPASSTSTVKAIAVKDGYITSAMASSTITVNGAKVSKNTNIALGKNVTVSSSENPSVSGDKLVDNDVTTRWSSEFTDDQWFNIDLGGNYTINKVTLDWEASYATAYKIQTSVDGNSWNTVYSTTSGKGGDEEIVFDATICRYVRFQGEKRVMQYGYSLWEVGVYEAKKVEQPSFSLTSGNYSGNQKLQISSATKGVEIRYTTDGSTPNENSKLYVPSITLNKNTTIKAIAYRKGMIASEVTTATYTINGGSTTEPEQPTEPSKPDEGETTLVNVAKGKTASTSGTETDAMAAANAFDGDEGTRWSSNFADDAWIVVDLGKTYAVSKVVLNWEGAYGESYKIQTSTDGKNWTTAKDVTGKNGGIDTITFNTVNARYVRMQGVKRGLPYGYSLWEMEVYATVKETAEYGVVSKNKTATTSGAETEAMAAANAFDGDEGTRWSSNFADDAWISVDLGKTYAIDKVVLNWEAAYGKAYKIQTSTDGNNWTTVKDLTNQDGGEDTITFNAVNARYVRMQGVTRALPYGYSIYEFEVYGR